MAHDENIVQFYFKLRSEHWAYGEFPLPLAALEKYILNINWIHSELMLWQHQLRLILGKANFMSTDVSSAV